METCPLYQQVIAEGDLIHAQFVQSCPTEPFLGSSDFVEAEALHKQLLQVGASLSPVAKPPAHPQIRSVDERFALALSHKKGGNGVQRNSTHAAHLLGALAREGHVLAMYELGDIFQNGEGVVARDPMRAMKLYELAVEEGDHVPSMVRLGKIFQLGDGVPNDEVRAVAMYERAVAHGDVVAMNNLGVMLKSGSRVVQADPARAMELFERGEELGHVSAMYNLALLLKNGARGVRKDFPRAVRLYERAIERGSTNALYGLAVLLEEGGNGVEKDVDRARQLYKRAAGQGHASSKSRLTVLDNHRLSGSASVRTRPVMPVMPRKRV